MPRISTAFLSTLLFHMAPGATAQEPVAKAPVDDLIKVVGDHVLISKEIEQGVQLKPFVEAGQRIVGKPFLVRWDDNPNTETVAVRLIGGGIRIPIRRVRLVNPAGGRSRALYTHCYRRPTYSPLGSTAKYSGNIRRLTSSARRWRLLGSIPCCCTSFSYDAMASK
jgi:hypothetical protein